LVIRRREAYGTIRFTTAFAGSWLASRSKVHGNIVPVSWCSQPGSSEQRLSGRWLPETTAMALRFEAVEIESGMVQYRYRTGTRLSYQPNAGDPNLKPNFLSRRLFSPRKFMLHRQPPLEHQLSQCRYGTSTRVCIVHKTASAPLDYCRACGYGRAREFISSMRFSHFPHAVLCR